MNKKRDMKSLKYPMGIMEVDQELAVVADFIWAVDLEAVMEVVADLAVVAVLEVDLAVVANLEVVVDLEVKKVQHQVPPKNPLKLYLIQPVVQDPVLLVLL